MKNNASLLTLRIPNELKHNIKLVAEQQGISINQLALYALTKEIKEIQTYNKLEKFWINKDESMIDENFGKLLTKIKAKDNAQEVMQFNNRFETDTPIVMKNACRCARHFSRQ
jgi:S-adenosylmethionine hydrolase